VLLEVDWATACRDGAHNSTARLVSEHDFWRDILSFGSPSSLNDVLLIEEALVHLHQFAVNSRNLINLGLEEGEVPQVLQLPLLVVWPTPSTTDFEALELNPVLPVGLPELVQGKWRVEVAILIIGLDSQTEGIVRLKFKLVLRHQL